MEMTKAIDSIESTAAQEIRADKEDYIKDGLLYCHKCNTPKQAKINVFGHIKTPVCLCKCEYEKYMAQEVEQEKQINMESVKRLRKMGFPDAEMEKWTFDKDDKANEKVSRMARQYVQRFEHMMLSSRGILFYGSVGTGKTFISCCIANALIENGYPCLVTNFARLTNTISGMYEGKQEYLDSLEKFDLLVIDDLASERDTEYMGEIVQNIIDSRYRSGKPLIVTTNLTSQELRNPTDIRKQRIYSRLFEMCVPIEVKGKDRRKEKLKQEYEEIQEVLGI